MTRQGVLVFDVNETLLDLTPLAADFKDVFGSQRAMGEWFARLLHGSLVANALGTYRPFGVIAVEALMVLAARRGVEIGEGQAAAIAAGLSDLPAHPDVIPAMERLVDAGYRTAALTNGSTRAANTQIENAGLHAFFQRVISVEEVGVFKPDPRPYLHTAESMEVDISGMVMIAAHDWDVAGAAHAGARTAFISRPGIIWSLPGKPPGLVAPDLGALTDILIPR